MATLVWAAWQNLWLAGSNFGSWYLRSYLHLGWRTTEGVPSDWFGVCTEREREREREKREREREEREREREREARCFLIWLPAPECHLRALAGFHPCDFVLLHMEREGVREKRSCGHFDASSRRSYCISFLTSVWMDPVTLFVTLSALLRASESLQCEWVLQLWPLRKLLDEWGLVDTIIELFNTHKRRRSPLFFFFFFFFFFFTVAEISFNQCLPVYQRSFMNRWLHMKLITSWKWWKWL